ncbi:MAG: O-antigen ligase family protein [Halanaerobiales bacterium]|nr:O-antigen ligase family protein [Halanaerobiales bacterium]
MLKKIRSLLVLVGWFCIFALYPLGNTSLGLLLILVATILGYKLDNFKKNVHYVEYKLLGVFSLFMLVSSVQAMKPLEAIAICLGQILIFYLAFRGSEYLVQNKKHFERMFYLLYLSGLVSGIVAIYKYFHLSKWKYRTETLFTGINGTGTVLVIAIILSLVFLNKEKSLLKRRIGYLTLLIPLTGLILTFSRGAYLALGGALFIYFIGSKKRVALFLVFCIVMVGVVFIFVPHGQDRIMSIFSLEKNSARLLIWQSTIKMIKDNPLFGVGTGMFPSNYPNYKPITSKQNFALAHNLELQILAEFGLIGFLLFFSFIALVLKRNLQLIILYPDNKLYRGTLAALIGYLIHNQVDGTMVGVEIGTFFWILCGLVIHSYYLNYKRTNAL